jgi:predicted ATPase
LASRIDRLPPPEKELLQTLAVIGKEFSLSLVRQVTGQTEGSLQGRLSRLQTAEFIYEQPAFSEPDYVFKHALTQEVAYNSLLLERRKILHEHTAQAIEEVYRGRSKTSTVSWRITTAAVGMQRRQWSTSSLRDTRRYNGRRMQRRSIFSPLLWIC